MTDHIHAMNQLKVPRIQHTTLCVGAFVCACVRVRARVCVGVSVLRSRITRKHLTQYRPNQY